MKKKKQASDTAAATTTATSAVTTTVDIKSIVRDYSTFFDKLVDLIPSRFYLPSSEDKPWFQGLSKAAKVDARLKSIQNIKKSRRDRLDPEKSSKTTLDFLKESLAGDSAKKPKKKTFFDGSDGESDDGDDGGEEGEEERESGEGKSMTYEELRERLHKKIKELRAGRGGGEGSGERRMEKKRKRSEEWKERKGKEEEMEKREKERMSIEKKVAEAASEIEFGKVKLAASSDDALFNKKKKKKLSKEEELKRALELEEAKKDPEKGEVVKKQHAWKAATDRAMGIKVHDDPSLLKKSLRKDMKKQQKSKEKWKNRQETTKKMKEDKQNKRKENIVNRNKTKMQAKIAKREKKLMRPGFEGRKEGFVNGA